MVWFGAWYGKKKAFVTSIGHYFLPYYFDHNIRCINNSTSNIMQRWFVPIITVLMTSQCFGQAWIRQESGLTSELRAVAFFDSLHGFAAGDSCVKTSDGGKHWTLVPEIKNCNDILIDSNGILWFSSVGCDTFFYSLDRGKSFIKKYRQCMIRMATTGSKLFCTAPAMTIYSTSDSGNSWQPAGTYGSVVPAFSYFPSLFGIAYSSNYTGLAVGDKCLWINGGPSWSRVGAILLASFDSGKKWMAPLEEYELPLFLYAVQAIDTSTFIVAGDSSYIAIATLRFHTYPDIYLSPIGKHSSKNDTMFEALHFFNINRGFVIGTNGAILYTDNEGKFWSKIPSPDSTTLFRITFTDSARGWIVGANGVILHTDNGGWVGGTSDVKETRRLGNEGNSLAYNIDRDEWVLRTNDRVISKPTVTIFSILGVNVSDNIQCNEISEGVYTLPTGKLPNGFYIAKFRVDDQIFMLPLLQR